MWKFQASARDIGIALPALVCLALAQSACQTSPPTLKPAELERALPSDQRTLDSIETGNASLRRSFNRLRYIGKWKTRGYFSAQESDQVELLLFRFHTAHHHVNDIVDRYRKLPAESPHRQEAAALDQRASHIALEQSHFLVSTFADDPVAIDKLNQAYPRSDIPRDTYDRLAESLEPPLKSKTDAAILHIEDRIDDSTYLAQAKIFYRVSRLRKPSAHLVKFNSSQKQQVHSMLVPGDILLTYTAGFASDVFIPGAFKHGITYVGTVEQRHAAGLSPDRIILVGGHREAAKLSRDLKKTTTVDGHPANLIEAVAEGVKFSNLEHIMDTHINRLLVLRPKLGANDRARQVSRTFSYLDQDYDFRFDFADSSRQVCTEVIYRAIGGLKDIDFPLTRRGGHVTLSADDLVNYWLQRNPNAFELVLYAEEAPMSPGHRARILTGGAATERVKELMQSGGKD